MMRTASRADSRGPQKARAEHAHRTAISVIVPVYNGCTTFRDCLAGLARTDPAPDEVIVVADADTDESRMNAAEFGARVIVLDSCSGPAAARNAGAHHARGNILLFVDADVVLHQDALSEVARAFAGVPKPAAVFGSYDDEPLAKSFISQYKNLLHHYVHQGSREVASTFWAGCGAIRREVFAELGGFDERYRRPCIEDIELGYRLRDAGHLVLLRKTLLCKHLKVWTLTSLLKTDVLDRALPWSQLILRTGRFDNDLNLQFGSRASVLMCFGLVVSLLVTPLWPWFAAVAAALALLLLVVNRGLYRFLVRKRGSWFALRAVPMHWSYYLYGGAAFVASMMLNARFTSFLMRTAKE